MNGRPLASCRIGLVTPSASRLGGGVFEAVARQAQLIAALGGEPRVYAARDAFSEADAARFPAGCLRVAPAFGPRQAAWAPRLNAMMRADRLDCVHLHGVWQWPTRAASLWRRHSGGPLIVSPHGMFDPWLAANGRVKKALARHAWLRRALAEACRLHALTEAEVGEIAGECGRGDAVVIPNPAPPALAVLPADPRPPHVLYLGRIHRKKNLDALVAGWRAARLRPDARLTIAGWGDAADVAALRGRLADAPASIAFVGPVMGEAKAALLASARFMVLPSHGEGLPMAVLEAWAAGTPTLMSARCNLGEGFARGAAIDCGTSAGSVAAALEQADALPEGEWRAMAQAALDLASGPFSEARIAAQWAETYLAAIKR